MDGLIILSYLIIIINHYDIAFVCQGKLSVQKCGLLCFDYEVLGWVDFLFSILSEFAFEGDQIGSYLVPILSAAVCLYHLARDVVAQKRRVLVIDDYTLAFSSQLQKSIFIESHGLVLIIGTRCVKVL